MYIRKWIFFGKKCAFSVEKWDKTIFNKQKKFGIKKMEKIKKIARREIGSNREIRKGVHKSVRLN